MEGGCSCHENADARSAASSNPSSNPSSSATSHWHEYTAGVLQILKSDAHPGDRCAPLPEVYLRPEKIDKLAREITSRVRIQQVGSPFPLPPLPTVGMAFGGDVAVGRGPG